MSNGTWPKITKPFRAPLHTTVHIIILSRYFWRTRDILYTTWRWTRYITPWHAGRYIHITRRLYVLLLNGHCRAHCVAPCAGKDFSTTTFFRARNALLHKVRCTSSRTQYCLSGRVSNATDTPSTVSFSILYTGVECHRMSGMITRIKKNRGLKNSNEIFLHLIVDSCKCAFHSTNR